MYHGNNVVPGTIGMVQYRYHGTCTLSQNSTIGTYGTMVPMVPWYVLEYHGTNGTMVLGALVVRTNMVHMDVRTNGTYVLVFQVVFEIMLLYLYVRTRPSATQPRNPPPQPEPVQQPP